MRYFHGGAPGIKVGDFITPRESGDNQHLRDDCPTCVARAQGAPLVDDNLDPSLVYVTTDREYARVYAAGYGYGALYVVEPVGELTPSPDPVPSWGVTKAKVTGIYDPCVSMTAREIRRATRRYLA